MNNSKKHRTPGVLAGPAHFRGQQVQRGPLGLSHRAGTKPASTPGPTGHNEPSTGVDGHHYRFHLPINGELVTPPGSLELEFEWVIAAIEFTCNPFCLSDEATHVKLGLEKLHDLKLAYENDVGKKEEGKQTGGKLNEATTKVAASVSVSELMHAVKEARHKKNPFSLWGLFEVGISKEYKGTSKDGHCEITGKPSLVVGRYPFQLEFVVAHKFKLGSHVKHLDEETEYAFEFHYKVQLGPSKKAILLMIEEFEGPMDVIEAVLGSGAFAGLGLVSAILLPVISFAGLGMAEKTGGKQALCWAYALGYGGAIFVKPDDQPKFWDSTNEPDMKAKRENGASDARAAARKGYTGSEKGMMKRYAVQLACTHKVNSTSKAARIVIWDVYAKACDQAKVPATRTFFESQPFASYAFP